jgi:hypothetical protein
VSSEDQATALFARANPVPSLDLLDPIELMDIESLRTRSMRSRAMTDLTAIGVREATSPRRHWLTPAMATVGVLLLAVSMLMTVTPLANATPEVRVANTFMAALNDHDGLAIRGMYAVEDQELKWNPDNWVAVTEFNRALGFRYTDVDCVKQPPISYAGTEATPVECSWALEQDLTKALGLEATEGIYTVYVSGGDIVRAVETWGDPSSMNRSFDEFRSWVAANHDEDAWTMFRDTTDYRLPLVYVNSHASVETESLDLWDRYVDEFVAEHEG